VSGMVLNVVLCEATLLIAPFHRSQSELLFSLLEGRERGREGGRRRKQYDSLSRPSQSPSCQNVNATLWRVTETFLPWRSNSLL
jgi:hypothetical protein